MLFIKEQVIASKVVGMKDSCLSFQPIAFYLCLLQLPLDFLQLFLLQMNSEVRYWKFVNYVGFRMVIVSCEVCYDLMPEEVVVDPFGGINPTLRTSEYLSIKLFGFL